MENPFSYSGVVTGEAFCNRKPEMAALMRFIRDSQNILLYGHRRTGKSSLILNFLRRSSFKKSGVRSVTIDIYGTLSETDFIRTLYGGLTQIESSVDRLLRRMPSLKISFSIDPSTGSPVAIPGFKPSEAPIHLEAVMKIYQSYAESKRLLIVLDEFQEVAAYKEKGFEARLRKEIQQHDRISYLFSGSQTHLLQHMFGSTGRAFYKLARPFRLEPIDRRHYTVWALNLFRTKGVSLPEEMVLDIVDRCRAHPAYIQQFLYELWYADRFDASAIDDIETAIIQENATEYMALWDTLTQNQKLTIRMIVEHGGKGLYHTEVLQTAGFSSSGFLTRTLSSLIEKGLIQKNDTYRIQDPMFEKWLSRISHRR